MLPPNNILTKEDRRYWAAMPQVIAWVEQQIPDHGLGKVLEIGPGDFHFPLADVFVDFMDRPVPQGTKMFKVDVANEKLPFADKEFAYVYCRHVIEDMHNPFLLIEEMQRVARAGYIETPSPLAEICIGVDGGPPWYRGYHHHRYICWAHEGQLRLVPKYPIIEHVKCNDDLLTSLLKRGPLYWNTYFPWRGAINYKHLQNSLDFELTRDYVAVLNDALAQSQIASDVFIQKVPKVVEVANLIR